MSPDICSVDSLDPIKKISLMDLSYSRLDTYSMCPSKYFFSYIKKEPRQFNSAATLGNIVHAVLEDNVSSEQPINLDTMLRSYEEKKAHYDPNLIIDQDLYGVGVNILQDFYDRHEQETFHVAHKEMPFSFVLGQFMVNGFIDRLDEYDDKIEIIDYKTGKWEVPLKNIKDNLQLGIYALAASRAFPRKSNICRALLSKVRQEERPLVL